eukprot:TRINITY_DN802_c3_g1_i2.p1 TRINITY_DN802_c3_g1~~TRINITY_DN802_c3_g1_i2.p1  ORF type:complete len:630 (-),score=156.57 TRINITY_DN802_c3_g1_i2:28-1818(-)
MFSFERIILDEFTYSEGTEKSTILNGLSSPIRWSLSGTTPIGSFDDIKDVAAFVGVHVGVSDSLLKLGKINTKALSTHAEVFRYYRISHSKAWHERRHRGAQRFLDVFVRQNIAEIDEIKLERHDVHISLTPAERALYLELDHHLQAVDMKTKRTLRASSIVANSDRVQRLQQALSSSETAEEALIKCSSHFDLAGGASAEAACDRIVGVRQEQLISCRDNVLETCKIARAKDKLLQKDDRDYRTEAQEKTTFFSKWLNEIIAMESGSRARGHDEHGDNVYTVAEGKTGDQETDTMLRETVSKAMEGQLVDTTPIALEAGDDEGKVRRLEIREYVHKLRQLAKELCGRVRSLRYFKALRDVQLQRIVIKCIECQNDNVPTEEQAVLSCCGHVGCLKCVSARAYKQECLVPGCAAVVRESSVISADDLEIGKIHQGAGQFGSKLQRLVELVEEVPRDEFLIVFAQFPALMEAVGAALSEAKIGFVTPSGTTHQTTKALREFMDSDGRKGRPRVLLLNVVNESASGLNMTKCNHVVFLHSMHQDTQQEFDACETQAVGRIRRYGQTKVCHMWRLLVEKTIDAEIYEKRVHDKDRATRP